MTREEAIIKEFEEKFTWLMTHPHKQEALEQFIRDALAKYKAEILDDANGEVQAVMQVYALEHPEIGSLLILSKRVKESLSELKGKNE